MTTEEEKDNLRRIAFKLLDRKELLEKLRKQEEELALLLRDHSRAYKIRSKTRISIVVNDGLVQFNILPEFSSWSEHQFDNEALGTRFGDVIL